MENEGIGRMIGNVIKNGFKRKMPVGMAIFGPIIIMIVLGYMVTIAGTSDTVNIGVVNQDQGLGNVNAASSIIEDLKEQDNVNVIYISQNEINNDFKDRSIDAAVVFPENFTRDLAMKKSPEVSLQAEGTDQIKSALVNRALLNSTMTMAAKSGNTPMPLKISSESFYGEGLSFTNLFIYHIMALVTLLISAIIGLFTVLRDKNSSRFSKIILSPVKAVAAYIIGLSIFAFIAALMVLSYAIYVMDITIVGNMGSTVLVMLLIALAGVSLGILAAAATRTEKQALGLFGLIIILQVLFGGLFIPVARLDYYIQLLSYSLPLTYGLDAMQSVVIRGFGLGDVGTDMIAISAIIIIALVLSMVGLKVGQNYRTIKEEE
ncbi:ABC transporter permease [Methanobacterium sp.]|uniref:ABC transporter permease n=1 Tax=Methanobacterium sp. TaxID=2164 RepID=UPI003C739576